ncbi:MAG: nicotinate-nucleotide--dimethylbenzimidazole phosphoribosyltransferase [Actinomycetota bacterium]|nr:nicotinate-nucleotide--dimethylbenzimidazole phosphoribosyltransferase [Actinomycetota bacterium]
MTLADRVNELVAEVVATNPPSAAAANARQLQLAKPPGSLGSLEPLGARLSAIAGTCPPPVPTQPALLVAAGDHGVHTWGVTRWPQTVTCRMVEALCRGGAAANVLADMVGARVCVVDVGVAGEPADHPRLRRAHVRPGTADLRTTAAMSEEEAARAVLAGAGIAEELVAAGADLLLTGDLGLANTTAGACLVAALTGADPAAVTGPGAGADDAGLARKRTVVAEALIRHGQDRGALGVLASLGGLEHAALVGLILAGAAEGLPVLLDGIAALAAALVAAALAPDVVGYLIAGHRSAEPGASIALTHLGLEPLLDLGLRLGEGTGALLAVPLVQAAARVLRDLATLDDLEITPPSPAGA